jgi:hypothetical protein
VARRVGPSHGAPPRLWCLAVLVRADGSVAARVPISGPGDPDMSAVDRIARLSLLATRWQVRLVLCDVAERLGELLSLAGLPLEVEGESERREQSLRIQEGQEEAERRDLPF